MSHRIYHTEGVVLGKAPFGESNYVLSILTKDMGVVPAVAQGVRELKSKLRSNLQVFSYGHIDLVRGKEVWRVTNARTIRSFSKLLDDREKRMFYARIAVFLKRLMPGERAHEALLNDLHTALVFLEDNTITGEDMKNIEAILVMRILNDLGYWGNHDAFTPFLACGEWNMTLITTFSPHRLEAQKTINAALKESHL